MNPRRAAGPGSPGRPSTCRCTPERQRIAQVDGLDGHVHVVPARPQLAQEAVRHEAVSVGPVVGQERRGVGHEDPMCQGVDHRAAMGVGCTASVPRSLRYIARSVSPQDRPTSSYGLESAEPQSTSLLATLRRRALIVVVTVLLVGGAAAAIGFLKGSVYQSTSKLLFSQTIGPELNATGLLPTSLDADNLAQDNIAAVDSHNVARATARELGDTTSVDDLQKDVSVTGTTKDDIVSITASSSSPRRAARVSTAWANAGVDAVERAAKRRAQQVLDNLNSQIAGLSAKARDGREGDRLRALAERVQVLAQTGTGAATVIQSGVVPTTKSGNPVRTIILGLLFGLVLGVGLALLREQADSRLHRPDEVSAAFDAPVLTTVPRNRALRRHVPFPDLPPEVAEAYRMLQANLRYGRGDRVRTVLVTSARSQEGKTTTSWYLATPPRRRGSRSPWSKRTCGARRSPPGTDFGPITAWWRSSAASSRWPRRCSRSPASSTTPSAPTAAPASRSSSPATFRPTRSRSCSPTGSASCSRCSSSATTSSWSTRRRSRTWPTPSVSCATSRACSSPRR